MPEQRPQHFYRALMFPDAATRTNGRNWRLERANLSGTPAPEVGHFFPTMIPGSYTGQWQSA